jgi:hypothetical protein
LRNLIIAFSVIGLLLLSGCALLFPYSFLPYKGLPIEAWVVDAETKQPLENVIVRMQWESTRGGFDFTGTVPFIIKETVTDSNGHFHFPEWEQRIRGMLAFPSPSLIFLKEGYKVLRESNAGGAARDDKPSALKSWWHGKIIALHKPKTQKEYEDHILFLGNRDVRHIINLECMWKDIPRTLAFLFKTNIRLFGNTSFASRSGKSLGESIVTIERLAKITTERCGDPRIFLEEYLK